MHLLRFIAIVLLIAIVVSCTRARRLASESGKTLPPVVHGGVPTAPGDQLPVSKTSTGFVQHPIPGIPAPPVAFPKYTIYVGPSD